jgi:uncharacterized membrane-anchored protein
MSSREDTTASLLSKAPPAILGFWLVKICATTAGETGGDALSMSLNLGYATASLIFLGFFLVALFWQLSKDRYRPLTYWAMVVATTTIGTTTSDFLDRTAHFGYVWSSAFWLALVAAILIAWRLVCGRIQADKIMERRDEIFYWLAIVAANTLGTALGDFAADETGLNLGFVKGAALFSGLIVGVGALWRFRLLPAPVLFWAAYVLTRPLGATLGDTLTKPMEAGGFNLDRIAATLVILGAMAVLVLAFPRLKGAPDAA